MSKIIKTILASSSISILVGCGGGGNAGSDAILKTEGYSSGAALTIPTIVIPTSE
jgi:hypothetical protein